MATIRSFIAVPIPDKIKQFVQDWVQPFRKHDTSIKWVRPEGMHLTLKFLGNVEEGRFESEFFPEFKQLLSPFSPITLNVEGVGQFPSKGIPRILWLGMGGEAEPLKNLANQVDDFFERFGFLKEKRTFSSHLTLARIKKKPSSGFLKVWNEAPSPAFGEFVVDQLVFYRSELTHSTAPKVRSRLTLSKRKRVEGLTREGAVYSVIQRFSIRG